MPEVIQEPMRMPTNIIISMPMNMVLKVSPMSASKSLQLYPKAMPKKIAARDARIKLTPGLAFSPTTQYSNTARERTRTAIDLPEEIFFSLSFINALLFH